MYMVLVQVDSSPFLMPFIPPAIHVPQSVMHIFFYPCTGCCGEKYGFWDPMSILVV